MTLSSINKPFPVSVITTCYGRNHHLYNLLSSLDNGSVKPDEVIIVNDDADPNQLTKYALNIVQIPTNEALANKSLSSAKTGFDIGRNRNIGAPKATHEALIFLDVDCIAAPTFIESLAANLQANPDALFMGQPRYLTRPLNTTESNQLKQGMLAVETLNELSVFNPYRFNFEPKNHFNFSDKTAKSSDTENTDMSNTQMQLTEDYGGFWSLCFAISRQQFERIGGFDTRYIGYGAEDTDFAFMARALDIAFYLTNDVVYHQQHSVYRPPLNHLSSIVINANRFYDKWQHWPMGGWLESFAKMGLIAWQEQQQTPIEILRQPTEVEINAAHYPDAAYV
ncbi:glycosyltransferase family 2 protein [Psychrobacter jeotgali]|uniref:glycosyltransferase family 2 protein n=1 Tax=Psychrobacter jeotgali TaxID=179010 RepID=UPI00191A01D5|nr:glycosyltransferase [Psychrobacter jeotgali]